MSFDCIDIPIIPNPIGIELLISKIQTKLITLSWMEFAFGRAWRTREIRLIDGEEDVYFIPKVYTGDEEYLGLNPSDEVTAYSFIELPGDETIDNYEPLKKGFQAEQEVAVVVWANLKMIDNTRNYIFDEELKLEVIKKLNTIDDLFEIVNIERGIEDVWANYSYNDFKPAFFSEVFATFRITYRAIQQQNCIPDQIYTLNPC